MFKKTLSFSVILCFFLTTLGPIPKAHADTVLGLPQPGTMIDLSPAYQPAIIRGLTIHKDNPFLFDFIVDVGQDNMSGEPLKKESEKLIKYFLATLAIPDKDLWVNLSPYEKNRIIPEVLGQTDMGRDLLEQDYILKQLTASLIYPEKQLGKIFWDKVYTEAQQKFGTTQIPVNTFNKVWIMADKAEVFEHNQTVFVVDCHLKVMLEEDYLSLQRHADIGIIPNKATTHSIGSQIIREIVLPELEKEVNQGKNFAPLRQIFNSIILSSWYKRNLKNALLNQVYANKDNVKGIDLSDPTVKEQIYQQYLKAYKKGVFNYIKEDVNGAGATIPRKYFSGGVTPGVATSSKSLTPEVAALDIAAQGNWNNGVVDVRAGVSIGSNAMAAGNLAMNAVTEPTKEYFPGIGNIKYEGPESVNHLAFHWYNPDEVIGGVKMKDFLKFSVVYWHTMKGDGSDMFGAGTMNRPWLKGDNTTNEGRMKIAKQTMDAMFEFLVKIGAPFWTFHDRDIAPEAYKADGGIDVDKTRENLEEMVQYAKQKQEETGVKLLWGTANLFSNPRFRTGAGSAREAEVIPHAAAQIKAAIEATYELGGANYVFWGGREGYTTPDNTDMKLEKENIAALMKIVVDYNNELAKKYGYKVQLLIEPKPKEPSAHQYDYDVATAYAFLLQHGLANEFKFNIEPNHVTLAGHVVRHDLQVAQDANALGSIDANKGNPELGWDTDLFIDFKTAMEVMMVVLAQGGLGKGGLNFDAKVRRESTDLDDLFIAHIAGMDALAHAFKAAYRLYTESDYLDLKKAQYKSHHVKFWEDFRAGKIPLAELEKRAAELGEPTIGSGKQELLEYLVQLYEYMPGQPKSQMSVTALAERVSGRKNLAIPAEGAGKATSAGSPQYFGLREGTTYADTGIVMFGSGGFLRTMLDMVQNSGYHRKVMMAQPRGTATADALIRNGYDYHVKIQSSDSVSNETVNIVNSVGTLNNETPGALDKFYSLAGELNLDLILIGVTDGGIQRDNPVFEKLTRFLFEYSKTHPAGNAYSKLSIIDTDNKTWNGDIIQKIVLDIIAGSNVIPAESQSSFIEWLKTQVTFHNSMVDRIVAGDESPTDAVTEPAPKLVLSVQGEISDRLAALQSVSQFRFGRTHEQLAQDYALKLRIANATHTVLSYVAALSGYEFVRDAIKDNDFKKALELIFETDILPGILADKDLNKTSKINEFYVRGIYEEWISRLANPVIPHRTFWIAQGGLDKIIQRFIPTVRANEGKASPIMAFSIAAILRYFTSLDHHGDLNAGKLDDGVTFDHSFDYVKGLGVKANEYTFQEKSLGTAKSGEILSILSNSFGLDRADIEGRVRKVLSLIGNDMGRLSDFPNLANQVVDYYYEMVGQQKSSKEVLVEAISAAMAAKNPNSFTVRNNSGFPENVHVDTRGRLLNESGSGVTPQRDSSGNILSGGNSSISRNDGRLTGLRNNSGGKNKAQLVIPGGIDLNTSNGMQWKVSKDGQGVEMNFEPAMIARFRRDGIGSLSPVIFQITPIISIWQLAGLQAPVKNQPVGV